MEKFHLKGLDGLRAIASIAVVIGHIELIKKNNQLNNYFADIKNLGSLAVVLFFVLSGFLITTLLMREKTNNGSINLKKFYLRRILRVWPLYYLILVLSAFIFSYSPSWVTIMLCVTIFPNIAHALSYHWIYSPQIWSIGVEEQFYLFWPALLRLKNKFTFKIIMIILLSIPVMPHILQYILTRVDPNPSISLRIEKIFEVLKFNCMAIGAVFGILFYKRNNYLLFFLENKFLRLFFVALPFVLWFTDFSIKFFNSELYALLFGLLIISIANGSFVRFFDFSILKYLGKISYGIYMYHWIILLLVFNYLKPHFSDSFFSSNLLLYIMTIGITLLVASLSFYLFENKMLKLKEKYE